ncbi:golgin subfamily A member 6-like protein 25 [Eleginops maclovinus]|uniref:golgin subfamily A member 6-like protein 25 n=1 Tax=Eleginops maclovinus TaxID=56733 RepID=UPI00308104BC
MDRRNPQNHRGNSRPFDHGAVADRAYSQIHCRNGQIHGLHEFRSAFQQERVSFGHRIRYEKDKVKHLEGLLNHIDSGNDQQLKRQFDTIKNCEAEISRLKKNMKAAECQHKQQVDIILARHVVEKAQLSDQSNQGTSHSQNSDGTLQLDAETTKLLIRKGDELSECLNVWVQRYSALEETMEAAEQKHKQQLEETVAGYEAQQQKLSAQNEEANLVNLNLLKKREEELLQYEERFTKNLAEKQQMELKLKEETQEKTDLAKENLRCKTDVKQLKEQIREHEEKFSKDLADKSALTEKVEAAERQHKQHMDDMVAGYEAQQQKLSAQNDKANLVNLNLLKKREEELLQYEESFTKNLAEKQQMELKLKEETQEKTDLAKKNLRCETDVKQLKEQIREHEEKSSKDLADKSALTEKVEAAERQHKQHMDDMVAGYEAQQQKLSAQNEEANLVNLNLLKKREEELLQYEERFTKNLAEKQQMELKLKEETQEKTDLAKENLLCETDVKQLKEQIREHEEKSSKDLADKSALTEKVEAAERQHKQHMDDMVAGYEAQQQKLSAQNDKANLVNLNLLKKREEELLQYEESFTKNLAEKQQMEMKLKEETQEKTDLAKENLRCETDVKQLKEQMREHEERFSKDLAQNQETLQTKVKLVETKLSLVSQEKEVLAQQHQNLEKELKEVQAELKMVKEEKTQSSERGVKLMETKVKQFEEQTKEQQGKFYKDLAQKKQSWETKEKKMEEEKKLLEDLCLYMKNKRRGFLFRRRDTEDRDVTLQKMLSKMQEKEKRKKQCRGGAEA